MMKHTTAIILVFFSLLPVTLVAQSKHNTGIVDRIKGVFSTSIKIGTYTFNDGAIYSGELKSGKPNGKGKTTFPTGDIYEGEYVKGKRQGSGTYIFTAGEKYEGEWFQDQQHGHGIMH